MALILHKGRPAARAVPLGGGAIAYIRPATSFECDLAVTGATKILAGLTAGAEAAEAAVQLLGEEFMGADFTQGPWIDVAAQRIALLELATLCCARWEGVCAEDGTAIEVPTREWLALVLREPTISVLIRAAVHARVNEERAEKNGSAALPNGGAAAVEASAPVVVPSVPLVPKADAVPTADAAQSSNTHP